jgi:hypothetical protein
MEDRYFSVKSYNTMKSSVIFVVLLVAFVCSLTTRQQLKSPDMQGFIQKREMASYARKTHAEENIDAYNALRVRHLSFLTP